MVGDDLEGVMVNLRVGRRKDPVRRQVEMLGRWLVREVGLRDEAERRAGAHEVMAGLVGAVVERLSRTPITRAPLYHDAMALALTVDNGLEYCYCPPMPVPPSTASSTKSLRSAVRLLEPNSKPKGLFGKKKGAGTDTASGQKLVWELCVTPIYGNEWDDWVPPPPPPDPKPAPGLDPEGLSGALPATTSPDQPLRQAQESLMEPNRGILRRSSSKEFPSEPPTPGLVHESRPGTPKSVRFGDLTARGLQEVGGEEVSPGNEIMARFKSSTMLAVPAAQSQRVGDDGAPATPPKNQSQGGKERGPKETASKKNNNLMSGILSVGSSPRPGSKRGLAAIAGISTAIKRSLSMSSRSSRNKSDAPVKKPPPRRPRRVPGWACREADVIMLQAGIRGHIMRCKVRRTVAALPEPLYTKHFDYESGNQYFVCTLTGRVTWIRPSLLFPKKRRSEEELIVYVQTMYRQRSAKIKAGHLAAEVYEKVPIPQKKAKKKPVKKKLKKIGSAMSSRNSSFNSEASEAGVPETPPAVPSAAPDIKEDPLPLPVDEGPTFFYYNTRSGYSMLEVPPLLYHRSPDDLPWRIQQRKPSSLLGDTFSDNGSEPVTPLSTGREMVGGDSDGGDMSARSGGGDGTARSEGGTARSDTDGGGTERTDVSDTDGEPMTPNGTMKPLKAKKSARRKSSTPAPMQKKLSKADKARRAEENKAKAATMIQAALRGRQTQRKTGRHMLRTKRYMREFDGLYRRWFYTHVPTGRTTWVLPRPLWGLPDEAWEPEPTPGQKVAAAFRQLGTSFRNALSSLKPRPSREKVAPEVATPVKAEVGLVIRKPEAETPT